MNYKCEYGNTHTLGDACHCELSVLKAERNGLMARVAELMGRNEVLEAAGDAKSELTRKAISQLTTANAIIEQAREALEESQGILLVGKNSQLPERCDKVTKVLMQAISTITEYQKGWK